MYHKRNHRVKSLPVPHFVFSHSWLALSDAVWEGEHTGCEAQHRAQDTVELVKCS